MDSILLFGIVATALGIALVASALRRSEFVNAAAVLADLRGETLGTDEFSARLREPFFTRLLRPLARNAAERIGGLLPRARIETLRHKLLVAGVLRTVGPEEFIVMQGIGGGGGVLLGLLLAQSSGATGFGVVRTALILGVIGLMAPVAWMNRKREARQGSIRKELPDVLDLMAISVEAGVGFEGALEIVCRHFNSPLAEELSRTLREMELGLPRKDALQNLKRRTEVADLSNFIVILIQADALGMPIGRVLRTQSAEMRSKRRQWAREKAGKLPVKILGPLILFILPAIFVVILGPAAQSIMNGL